MSAGSPVATAGPSQFPAFARELAGRLSVLLSVMSRSRGGSTMPGAVCGDANEWLWSGVSPDALGLVCDGVPTTSLRNPTVSLSRR